MSTVARRALFATLIVLTALRGMVGDVMAYGMNGPTAAQSIAISADSKLADKHLEHQSAPSMPCHEPASAQAADNSKTDSEPVCSTCQVCHLSVTLPVSVISPLPVMPNQGKPSLPATSWVSADVRPLSKPPLS